MAGWAVDHGASRAIQAMCERVVVGQRDEILIMQNWLRDRGQPIPHVDPAQGMAGMTHAAHMPGMLTPEQMGELNAAKGAEFDRLFLTYMIQHHQGAVTMVNQLFATQGGGQEELVFRLASDIFADQTTEIDRMQKMLAALPTGESHP